MSLSLPSSLLKVPIKATVVEGMKPCCYQKKKDKNRAQKPAGMDSCFGLVRPHLHGTASRCALGSNMIDINVIENRRVMLKPQACALITNDDECGYRTNVSRSLPCNPEIIIIIIIIIINEIINK